MNENQTDQHAAMGAVIDDSVKRWHVQTTEIPARVLDDTTLSLEALGLMVWALRQEHLKQHGLPHTANDDYARPGYDQASIVWYTDELIQHGYMNP